MVFWESPVNEVLDLVATGLTLGGISYGGLSGGRLRKLFIKDD